jgi:hypothetical protein
MQAPAADPDLFALFLGAVKKAGKPCQRHAEGTTVIEVNPEAVLIEADMHWDSRNAHFVASFLS